MAVPAPVAVVEKGGALVGSGVVVGDLTVGSIANRGGDGEHLGRGRSVHLVMAMLQSQLQEIPSV